MRLLQTDKVMIGVAAELLFLCALMGCTLQVNHSHKAEVIGMSGGIKALVVVAPQNFRDEELQGTLQGLESHGIGYTIVSTRSGECKGMLGMVVKCDGIDEVNTSNYDALIFIGGSGIPVVRQDERFLNLAQEFYEKGKVVAAICWSPTILAKAGVLKGKNATVWVGFDPEYNEETPKVLEQYGARFVDEPVVVDGRIVTGNGPAAADEFGKVVAQTIEKYASR